MFIHVCKLTILYLSISMHIIAIKIERCTVCTWLWVVIGYTNNYYIKFREFCLSQMFVAFSANYYYILCSTFKM